MAMPSPIAGSPSTRNIGCGGSAKPRRTLRDVAHPDHAPAGDEVDVQDVLLGPEGAGDPQRDALVAGLDDAGGADLVLGADRRQQRRRSMPRLASCSIENSTKITSSWAPMMSIFETSGTLQELGADLLDVIAQLAVGEPVGGEAVDDAEHVAEAVVEERARPRRAAACARRR